MIYLWKKIFCILTINEQNMCILPYRHIKSTFIQRTIVKIIARLTNRVALSNYLNGQDEFKNMLKQKKIYLFSNEKIHDYMLFNIVEYISKMQKRKVEDQEIHILIKKMTSNFYENVMYFLEHIKRINIVTYDIASFSKLEDYLEEELGIGITVTNNKRKSLAKAKIIINLDFTEEMINSFSINRNAIIIETNGKAKISSRLFNGINILNYQIKTNRFDNNILKQKFDDRILYESILYNKKYEDIRNILREDGLIVTNLIGKNGIIHESEYDKKE